MLLFLSLVNKPTLKTRVKGITEIWSVQIKNNRKKIEFLEEKRKKEGGARRKTALEGSLTFVSSIGKICVGGGRGAFADWSCSRWNWILLFFQEVSFV